MNDDFDREGYRAHLNKLRAGLASIPTKELLRIGTKLKMPSHLLSVLTPVYESQIADRFEALEKLLSIPDDDFSDEQAMACESEMDAIEEVLDRQGNLIAEAKDWLGKN